MDMDYGEELSMEDIEVRITNSMNQTIHEIYEDRQLELIMAQGRAGENQLGFFDYASYYISRRNHLYGVMDGQPINALFDDHTDSPGYIEIYSNPTNTQARWTHTQQYVDMYSSAAIRRNSVAYDPATDWTSVKGLEAGGIPGCSLDRKEVPRPCSPTSRHLQLPEVRQLRMRSFTGIQEEPENDPTFMCNDRDTDNPPANKPSDVLTSPCKTTPDTLLSSPTSVAESLSSVDENNL